MCGASAGKCRSKLGGKDPAYVRPDADLDYTVPELVDGEEDSIITGRNHLTSFLGAFFNSGQSCCAVEVGAVGHLNPCGILTGHDSVSMSTSLYTTHSLVDSWKQSR